MTTKNIKTFSELSRLRTFEERYEYLRLSSKVGRETFGAERVLNQAFYRSPEWKIARNKAILRDEGCDLGDRDRPIIGRIEIHHINPITIEDIENGGESLFDLDNLVCTSPNTHKAIHYGDASLITNSEPNIRKPNDTCPWL